MDKNLEGVSHVGAFIDFLAPTRRGKGGILVPVFFTPFLGGFPRHFSLYFPIWPSRGKKQQLLVINTTGEYSLPGGEHQEIKHHSFTTPVFKERPTDIVYTVYIIAQRGRLVMVGPPPVYLFV